MSGGVQRIPFSYLKERSSEDGSYLDKCQGFRQMQGIRRVFILWKTGLENDACYVN